MRALAEFIMRGRAQAAVVALAGNWIPLLTPATVGLVTLRQGVVNGLQVLTWALLPALLMLIFSPVEPLLPLLVVTSGLLAFATSLVLRATASWAHTLMVLIAMACGLALAIGVFSPGALNLALEMLDQWRHQLHGDEVPERLAAAGRGFVLGMMAYIMAFSSVAGLIVARWWQALLYNPGGFREEFHRLRLQGPQALLCLLVGVYCLLQPLDISVWAALFTLPLTLAGLALVHRLAAIRNLAGPWLVLFYAALMILPLVAQLLVLVAFLDSWLDFRARLQRGEDVDPPPNS